MEYVEKDSLEQIFMCNAQCLNFRTKYGVMETASRELASQDIWNYVGEELLVVGGLAVGKCMHSSLALYLLLESARCFETRSRDHIFVICEVMPILAQVHGLANYAVQEQQTHLRVL